MIKGLVLFLAWILLSISINHKFCVLVSCLLSENNITYLIQHVAVNVDWALVPASPNNLFSSVSSSSNSFHDLLSRRVILRKDVLVHVL